LDEAIDASALFAGEDEERAVELFKLMSVVGVAIHDDMGDVKTIIKSFDPNLNPTPEHNLQIRKSFSLARHKVNHMSEEEKKAAKPVIQKLFINKSLTIKAELNRCIKDANMKEEGAKLMPIVAIFKKKELTELEKLELIEKKLQMAGITDGDNSPITHSSFSDKHRLMQLCNALNMTLDEVVLKRRDSCEWD
jgi:hypothetical protein